MTLFDSPKPVYSYEVEIKSKTKILDSIHIDKNQRMVRKAKGKSSYVRPLFFTNHICESESNCIICRSIINGR